MCSATDQQLQLFEKVLLVQLIEAEDGDKESFHYSCLPPLGHVDLLQLLP